MKRNPWTGQYENTKVTTSRKIIQVVTMVTTPRNHKNNTYHNKKTGINSGSEV